MSEDEMSADTERPPVVAPDAPCDVCKEKRWSRVQRVHGVELYLCEHCLPDEQPSN